MYFVPDTDRIRYRFAVPVIEDVSELVPLISDELAKRLPGSNPSVSFEQAQCRCVVEITTDNLRAEHMDRFLSVQVQISLALDAVIPDRWRGSGLIGITAAGEGDSESPEQDR